MNEQKENTANPQISQMLERFADSIESEKDHVLTDEEKTAISASVSDEKTLSEGLAELKRTSEDYKSRIADCDQKIKMWQESKKMWKNRSDQFNGLLGFLLSKLSIPGLSLKAGGVKLSTSKRTSLEVDEDWLVGLYQLQANALQAQLPPYIKVSLSLDKTALGNYLKTDNSMLVNNPDKVHTKQSASTTIK